VIGTADALRPDAPLVWPQHRSNIVFDVTLGEGAADRPELSPQRAKV
jgi:hypothetical protein